jgi:hypothetical protein
VDVSLVSRVICSWGDAAVTALMNAADMSVVTPSSFLGPLSAVFLEELIEGLSALAFADPDNSGARVVHHNGHVLVVARVRQFVHAGDGVRSRRTTGSTISPTVTHDTRIDSLIAVLSIRCAQHPISSSNSRVNQDFGSAHGSTSARPPQRGRRTRRTKLRSCTYMPARSRVVGHSATVTAEVVAERHLGP